MAGPFYFAWVESGDVEFEPTTHAREDERVYSVHFGHSEGDFATLELSVRNPKVGLLGTDRYRWMILSWNNGSEIKQIFKGRVNGVTTGISGELMTLEFIARPDDYEDLKAAVTDDLRHLPRYDPIWFEQGGTVDQDQVLECYSALLHISPTTLEVGTSDIIEGEAGTIELTADDLEYDGLSVSDSEKPTRRARAKGTVTWTQSGEGLIDISTPVTIALRESGPGYSYPAFTTLTGDGLVGAWPKKDQSIGEGWTVTDSSIVNLSKDVPQAQTFPDLFSASSTIIRSSGRLTAAPQFGAGGQYGAQVFRVKYYEYSQEQLDAGLGTHFVNQGLSFWFFAPVQWIVDFPVPALVGKIEVKWRAARKRTETISFTLEADLQEIDNDLSIEATEETIELSSDYVGQAIDPFSLSTDIILLNDSTAATLVSSQDLVAGVVYQVTSDHVPFGTTFVAPSDAGAENLAITLSSAATEDKPEGESCEVSTTGVYPIGDLRSNHFFTTDRGRQAFECLLYLCRAKLLVKSRAVEVKVKPINWTIATAITLQHGLIVHDDRLPGGVATGKVTDISLTFEDGKYEAEITIKCCVGKGNELTPSVGTGTYAAPGYMLPGYQQMEDATVSLDVGDLQYEDYTFATVTDDDGVDLFHMNAGDLVNIDKFLEPQRYVLEFSGAVKSITVDWGAKAQARLAFANTGNMYTGGGAAAGDQYGDPIKAVSANPTTVDIKLVSMTGEFLTEISPRVSKLMIPRSIDLEAAG